MTRKEADALISYIEFMASLTEDYELMNRPPVLVNKFISPEDREKFEKDLIAAGMSGGAFCPNPEPSVSWLDEVCEIDPDKYDNLHTPKEHITQNHISIGDLWAHYKETRGLKDPIDSGHVVEFATYIRKLTVDEVKYKTTARVISSGGPFPHAIPQLTHPIDANFIPKSL